MRLKVTVLIIMSLCAAQGYVAQANESSVCSEVAVITERAFTHFEDVIGDRIENTRFMAKAKVGSDSICYIEAAQNKVYVCKLFERRYQRIGEARNYMRSVENALAGCDRTELFSRFRRTLINNDTVVFHDTNSFRDVYLWLADERNGSVAVFLSIADR
jgi:hypothetical protein